MGIHVAAVIPAFNVRETIRGVLAGIPMMVRSIIVVDDGSTDDTGRVIDDCARLDYRIHTIRHETNRGVGAAMVSGFRKALAIDAHIVVKIDGDGQMPVAMLGKLIEPLITGDADYTKGNRFRDFQAIRRMPAIRRFGNVGLSFLAKAATGYWHCFDPTNGFVAIRADVLRELPIDRIASDYYFEISMLSHLYLLGAVVEEEPMPAHYNGETSNLSIPKVVASFPGRLFASFLRRIFLKNYVYDFSVESLEIAVGLPLFLAGLIFGTYNWIWYASRQLATPTGTIALTAVMIILGFQLLLSAISLDLSSIPRDPINEGPVAFEQIFPQKNSASTNPAEASVNRS